MRVIIIGTGYVGSAYARCLHYLGFHPLILSRSWLDYTDPHELNFVLRSCHPDCVINCAGYTGRTVDDCEVNKQECYDSNVTLAKNIADACARIKCPLLHLSSGCIFNGDGPFTEEDEPNFIGKGNPFYTDCKRQAEKEVMKWEASWIFRIRMPFNQVNHPRNWLCKLRGYDKILDGLNSVTFLDEFCMRSWQLIWKASPGIYHAAYSTPVSTLQVARMMKPDAGPFNLHEFLKGHIRRSETVLDCAKFEKAYGCSFGDPMAAIRWCLQMLATTREGCRSGLAVDSSAPLTMSAGASASSG